MGIDFPQNHPHLQLPAALFLLLHLAQKPQDVLLHLVEELEVLVELPDVHPLHTGLHVLVLGDGPQTLIKSVEGLVGVPPLQDGNQEAEGDDEQGDQPQVQGHAVDEPVVLPGGHQDVQLPVPLHLPAVNLIPLPCHLHLGNPFLPVQAFRRHLLIGAVHDLPVGGLHQENAVHVRHASHIQLVQIPETGFHIDVDFTVILQRPVSSQQRDAFVLPGHGLRFVGAIERDVLPFAQEVLLRGHSCVDQRALVDLHGLLLSLGDVQIGQVCHGRVRHLIVGYLLPQIDQEITLLRAVPLLQVGHQVLPHGAVRLHEPGEHLHIVHQVGHLPGHPV